jgi:hypothetical protein
VAIIEADAVGEAQLEKLQDKAYELLVDSAVGQAQASPDRLHLSGTLYGTSWAMLS